MQVASPRSVKVDRSGCGRTLAQVDRLTAMHCIKVRRAAPSCLRFPIFVSFFPFSFLLFLLLSSSFEPFIMRLSFVIVVAATTVAVSAKNRLSDYIAVGSPKVYDSTDIDAEIPEVDHALRSLSTEDAFEESDDAEELLARAADDCAGINLRAWPGRDPVSSCDNVFTACALICFVLLELSDKRVSPSAEPCGRRDLARAPGRWIL